MTERLLFLEEGVVSLSFTARIERPPFHRGDSASKKDSLTAPYPDCALQFLPHFPLPLFITNHITFVTITRCY